MTDDKNDKKHSRWYRDKIEVVRPKMHIFYQEEHYEKFFPLSSLSNIASINSEVPVSNYADLMDQYNKRDEASRTDGIEEKPYKFVTSGDEVADPYARGWLKSGRAATKQGDGSYFLYDISALPQYNQNTRKYDFIGYRLQGYQAYSFKDGVFRIARTNLSQDYTINANKTFTMEEMETLPLLKLALLKSNGKKLTIK